LLCVTRDPESRLRDIADCIGITERATQTIVSDLVDAGYLSRQRVGNRNRYQVRPDVPMRHDLLADHWVGELLAVFADAPNRSQTANATSPKRTAGDQS